MKNLTELRRTPHAPKEQYWGPLVTEASINMLYGPRAVGKSFVCLSIAGAMMFARPLWGHTCPKERSVYVADAEMGERSYVQALQKVFPSTDLDMLPPSRFGYRSYMECEGSVLWNISNPKDQVRYESEFRDYQVLIFDNLSSICRPLSDRDSDLSQWARVQSWFVKLRDNGKAIILVHHSGKSGDQRGHSNKEDVMDNVFKLSPFASSGLGVEMRVTKGRSLTPQDSRTIRAEGFFTDTGLSWTFDYADSDITQRVLRMHNLKMSKTFIAQEAGVSMYRVHEIISEFERSKKQENTGAKVV